MELVQILLPVYSNQGQAYPKAYFDEVREHLTKRFGGVTAFLRSPAVGIWENDDGAICRDDIVLFEVIVEAVDRAWWGAYRRSLEQQFSQETILIRATGIELL